MTITYHKEVLQGSDEWLALRCGLLTASEMKLIITAKKLEYAQNDKERGHLYELAAQRINKYVEPSYIGDDMLRGMDDESYARETYHENYALVETCGFVTNDKWGFTLGWSPDGLCGDNGAIEAKSRKQKYQLEIIMTEQVPDEHVIQVQTGLLVGEREWLDYISYCGGMPMKVIRAFPDTKIQAAIVNAASIFHEKMDKIIAKYGDKIAGLIATERRSMEDIIV